MSKLRLEDIAALPFHRGGTEGEFDCGYACRVWDAQVRLAFDATIEADPYSKHDSQDGLLHYVPHGDGTGTIWRKAADFNYAVVSEETKQKQRAARDAAPSEPKETK